VTVDVGVGVAVDVGVGVAVDVAVGVGVRVGDAVDEGVGVALDVAVVVGDGVTVGGGLQGGKLGDFSGLKSGRKRVFVSMRRALESGLTFAVESGPNANVFSSPGRSSTGTVKAPADTGSNRAEPPRDGGMCCISSSGMSSETMASEVLTTVIAPTTPSGPQLASIETIVSEPRATAVAEGPARATLRSASPVASKRMPGSSRAWRTGMAPSEPGAGGVSDAKPHLLSTNWPCSATPPRMRFREMARPSQTRSAVSVPRR
jgi:hypothetical protein